MYYIYGSVWAIPTYRLWYIVRNIACQDKPTWKQCIFEHNNRWERQNSTFLLTFMRLIKISKCLCCLSMVLTTRVIYNNFAGSGNCTCQILVRNERYSICTELYYPRAIYCRTDGEVSIWWTRKVGVVALPRKEQCQSWQWTKIIKYRNRPEWCMHFYLDFHTCTMHNSMHAIRWNLSNPAPWSAYTRLMWLRMLDMDFIPYTGCTFWPLKCGHLATLGLAPTVSLPIRTPLQRKLWQ